MDKTNTFKIDDMSKAVIELLLQGLAQGPSDDEASVESASFEGRKISAVVTQLADGMLALTQVKEHTSLSKRAVKVVNTSKAVIGVLSLLCTVVGPTLCKFATANVSGPVLTACGVAAGILDALCVLIDKLKSSYVELQQAERIEEGDDSSVETDTRDEDEAPSSLQSKSLELKEKVETARSSSASDSDESETGGSISDDDN